MFSLQLEQIGRKRKYDPKAGLFSFNFGKGSSKKNSTSANSQGPEPRTGSMKEERSRSPHPSPGNRLGRVRSSTKSFLEIDGPIGSKRPKDVKAELFSFANHKIENGNYSQSLPLSRISSSNGPVESQTREASGNKKRRSTRFKALSIFSSSDESGEENEGTKDNREDLNPSPAKNRKLSNGKIQKTEKTNPINKSSQEIGQSSKLRKRGRPKKQSTNTDEHNHEESSNDNNQEEDSTVLPRKRGRPKKQSSNINDHRHEESGDDNYEENSPHPKRRGRPKKLNTHTNDFKRDKSMGDNSREEVSSNQSEKTREIVESGSGSGSPPQSEDDSDDDDDDSEKRQFVIEQEHSDYMKLKNSNLTNNLLVVRADCTKTVAGFMSPEFSSSQNEEYPGVVGVQNSLSDSIGIGYMKIQGKTIRPPEMSTGGRMIFWILEGSIKVKSAGGFYPRRDSSGEVRHYLYGKKLEQGTCIVMPKMTPFTLENWESADAVLGYCLIEGN